MKGIINKSKLRMFNSPLLAVGLFCLVNPAFNGIDVMPDFIGFLLIYFSLSELCEINTGFDIARQKSFYAAIVSAVKNAIVLFVYSESEGFALRSWILTIEFSFAVIEIILIIQFVEQLFEGVVYLAQRCDGEACLAKLQEVKRLTSLFLISRTALGILPLFTVLLETSKEVNVSQAQSLETIINLRPYMMLVMITTVVIFGLYWYSIAFKYFHELKREQPLMTNVEREYLSTLPQGVESYRFPIELVGSKLITLGMLCYIDLTIDRRHVLPIYIGSIIIAAGIFLMRKKFGSAKLAAYALVIAVLQFGILLYRNAFIDENAFVIRAMDFLTASITAGIAVVFAAIACLYFQKLESIFTTRANRGLMNAAFAARTVFFTVNAVILILPPLKFYLSSLQAIALILWVVFFASGKNRTINNILPR